MTIPATRSTRTAVDAPLAMDGATFRRLGHQTVERIADFLDSLPSRPLTTTAAPDALRGLLGADAPLPEDGTEPAALLDEAIRLLTENSLFNGHPRFFGYVTSSAAPIGALADMIAAAVNPNCGSWTLAPVGTEIEAQTVRWVSELIGYRSDCGGVLVSGGNMANFIGFLAARAAVAGQEVRTRGLDPAAPLRVYGSRETHTWIQKAADLFGLGTDAIRWIPVDPNLRMDLNALGDAIDRDVAAGARPMMVVAAAGTVSTGAVDPLRAIAALCAERDIWLHVDGAYGGFAAAARDAVAGGGDASVDAAADLGALALADSVAIDPHKWLYAPLEAGCVLARDRQSLLDAFSYHPAYYHFGQEATNYVDYGLQNSRGLRALKVWLALRQVGRAGYARMIGDDIRLARRLHARVIEHAELEPFTQALSITTFRYVPHDLREHIGEAATEERLNTINQELLDRVQKGGDAFVSNAVLDGTYVLRACIVNFNTTDADVDALPGIVARVGAEVAGEI